MARVDMWKCDTCGKLQDKELKYSVESPYWLHDGTPKREFKFYVGESCGLRDVHCCSDVCVRGEFDKWMKARIEEEMAEIEEPDLEAVITDRPIDINNHYGATSTTSPIASGFKLSMSKELSDRAAERLVGDTDIIAAYASSKGRD